MKGSRTTEKPLTRLHDMVVEEVSLVDRAANKRRFLLRKRGETMETNTELQSDGNGGFVTTSAAAQAAQVPEASATSTEKAKDEDEMKRPNARHDAMPEPPEKPSGKPKPKSPFPGAAPPFEAKAETDPVVKAGAKMRKERLERMKAALKALNDLLTEIDVSDSEPSAGCAATEKAEIVTPVTSSAPVAPSAPNPEVQKLVQVVENLAHVVKTQGSTLEKITKAAPTSTQVAVESKQTPRRSEVSWPLDMNDPVDRDHVEKDVSFHDA